MSPDFYYSNFEEDKMKELFRICAIVTLLAGLTGTADADLLYSASMLNGDYGGGAAIDTMDGTYGHGASPHVLGIVNSDQGTTFTSTEDDSRSNALINWQITDTTQLNNFRNHGTFSFRVKFDSVEFCPGWLFGDNYGFTAFHNGQGTFSSHASKMDDVVMLTWSAWYNGVWDYPYDNTNRLQFDRWYNVGYAWGGPDNDFEIWVDGILVSARNWSAGNDFPWGMEYPPSGTNFGFGDNHERGYDTYGSVAGATFADVQIWNEYRALGNTEAPVPSDPACVSQKLKAASALCNALTNCWAKEIKDIKDKYPVEDFTYKAMLTFGTGWGKAQAKAVNKGINCDAGSVEEIGSTIDDAFKSIYDEIYYHIVLENEDPTKLKDYINLGNDLLKAAGKRCSSLLKADSAYIKDKSADRDTRLGTAKAKADKAFSDSFIKMKSKAIKKGLTFDDASIKTYLEDAINDLESAILSSMGVELP